MMHFISYKIPPWFLAATCLIAMLLCTSRIASNSQILNLATANPFFVGREEKLKDIQNFFKKGSSIVALTGGPGFGKTQTAKRYVQLFQKDYDLIWWIDAQQDVPSQFERLAIALNQLLSVKDKIVPSSVSKEVLIDLVKNVLRTKKIKYILVFDNADEFTKIEKCIPYNHHENGKHILLTSRYASIWPDSVAIGQFERQESIAFIKKSLPKTTEEEREKLAETFSDYPLGLTLAVGFIKSAPTTTITKYLEMHMKRTLRRRENPPSTVLDRYPHGAQDALDLSLNLIEENSKEALATLFFMSLLNSKDIPESYVELWLKKKKVPLQQMRPSNIFMTNLFLA